MKKIRLDQLLFEKGLTESRERAKTSVMAGLVYVNGRKETKPGAAVAADARIELRGDVGIAEPLRDIRRAATEGIDGIERGAVRLEQARATGKAVQCARMQRADAARILRVHARTTLEQEACELEQMLGVAARAGLGAPPPRRAAGGVNSSPGRAAPCRGKSSR